MATPFIPPLTKDNVLSVYVNANLQGRELSNEGESANKPSVRFHFQYRGDYK